MRGGEYGDLCDLTGAVRIDNDSRMVFGAGSGSESGSG